MFIPSGADESSTAGVAVVAGLAGLAIPGNSVTASAARLPPIALSTHPRFDLDVIPHLQRPMDETGQEAH
jgi:hypothetical protein